MSMMAIAAITGGSIGGILGGFGAKMKVDSQKCKNGFLCTI